MSVVNVLLHIYAVHAWPESANPQSSRNYDEDDQRPKNGQPAMNGRARSASEAQHIHDAEAFELQGLISDEEGEGREDHGRPSMDPRKPDDEENSLRKETSAQH